EAEQLLKNQFKVQDLSGFGCSELKLALVAAGAILHYCKETQRTALPHITRIQAEHRDESLIMDASTRRNLELTLNTHGTTSHTLASVYDRTVTPMGSRLLRRWLHRPVRDHLVIKQRQEVQ